MEEIGFVAHMRSQFAEVGGEVICTFSRTLITSTGSEPKSWETPASGFVEGEGKRLGHYIHPLIIRELYFHPH